MCPCCGRSVIAGNESGEQRSLFHEDNEDRALNHGGETWELVPKGLGRGRGFENVQVEAPESLTERVVRELVHRCRAFLEKHDEA